MGMKYELFFLNNIHDSMEMVNVELAPFWDLWEGRFCLEETMICSGTPKRRKN